MNPQDLPVHALPADQALSRLAAASDGLTPDEASRRLAKIGRNRLPEPPRDGLLKRFFKHFHDILIYILLADAEFSPLAWARLIAQREYIMLAP